MAQSVKIERGYADATESTLDAHEKGMSWLVLCMALLWVTSLTGFWYVITTTYETREQINAIYKEQRDLLEKRDDKIIELYDLQIKKHDSGTEKRK